MASQEMSATKEMMREARRAGEGAPKASVEELRAGMETTLGALSAIDGVSTRAVEVAGLPGEWTLPERSKTKGTILYFHGGGYFEGSIATHRRLVAALSLAAGARGLSIGYRLAPEHRFPAAVDDCVASTEWVAAHGSELGVDPHRLAVAGDSAGGNLAAVVARRARDAGGPPIAFQLLVYPGIDMTRSFASHKENAEGYLLDRDSIDWFVSQYVEEADLKNPDASPWFADSLAGLPPALVITAEFDPLRDEGEAYAGRLREAGVPAKASRYDGMIHAFFGMDAILPAARAAVEEAAIALRGALHPAGS
jgi:acetyl esterase